MPPPANSLQIQKLSVEIYKVQHNIDAINKLKEDAVSALEKQKRDLRKQTSTISGKSSEEIQRNIDEVVATHGDIMEKLQDKQQEVVGRKHSIDLLDDIIKHMDLEISRLEAEHAAAVLDLEEKQRDLLQRLESMEKIDLLINALSYKIFEMQHDYREEMDSLQKERLALLARTDLTESQMAIQLAALDKKIHDMEENQHQAMLSLETQKADLVNESFCKAEKIDATLQAIYEQRDKLLAELEAQKLGATPSQLIEIERRIAELKGQFDADIAALRKNNSEERILALLEARGLRVTPSGRFLTGSGRLLTLEEAERLGLLEGISLSNFANIVKCQRSEKDESKQSDTSTALSWESGMSSEDVSYLKKVIGIPLVLALAEITAKQPRDPIHYLGHWLFKYRYNQEVDDRKKIEIEELLAERERLAREKWHRELEEEARAAVWEMILRAEEDAIRREMERELLRIARETAMLEEEAFFGGLNDEDMMALADEARDTLGVYDGPKTGPRVWDQNAK